MVSANFLARSISFLSFGIVQPTPRAENRINRVLDRNSPWKGFSEYAVLNFGLEAGQITSAQKDPFFSYNNIELLDFSRLSKARVLEALEIIDRDGGLPDKAKTIVLNQELENDSQVKNRILELVNNHDSITLLNIRYTNAEIIQEEPKTLKQQTSRSSKREESGRAASRNINSKSTETTAHVFSVTPIRQVSRISSQAVLPSSSSIEHKHPLKLAAVVSAIEPQQIETEVQSISVQNSSATTLQTATQTTIANVDSVNPFATHINISGAPILGTDVGVSSITHLQSDGVLLSIVPQDTESNIGHQNIHSREAFTIATDLISSDADVNSNPPLVTVAQTNSVTGIGSIPIASEIASQVTGLDLSNLESLTTQATTKIFTSINSNELTNAVDAQNSSASSSGIEHVSTLTERYIQLVSSNGFLFSDPTMIALVALLTMNQGATDSEIKEIPPILVTPPLFKIDTLETESKV